MAFLGLSFFIAGLVWLWLYARMHGKCRNLARLLEIERHEREEIGNFFSETLIPFMAGSADESDGDEELRSILLHANGVEYRGANFFVMKNHLFFVKERRLSPLNLMKSRMFDRTIVSLKKILDMKNDILASEAADLSYLDAGIHLEDLLRMNNIALVCRLISPAKNRMA